jgi:hypothetical protein
MKNFRLNNEAQKARDAGAARAREVAEQAAEQASGAAESVRAGATDLSGQITEHAAGMSEAGIAKLNETLADFSAALPVLREAGYTPDDVEVDLGIPPKVVAKFSGAGSVPDEKIEALLEKNSERSLAVLLVKSVQQATRLQSKLNIKGMKPRGLLVEVGFTPKIVVKFVPA